MKSSRRNWLETEASGIPMRLGEELPSQKLKTVRTREVLSPATGACPCRLSHMHSLSLLQLLGTLARFFGGRLQSISQTFLYPGLAWLPGSLKNTQVEKLNYRFKDRQVGSPAVCTLFPSKDQSSTSRMNKENLFCSQRK